MPRRFVHFSDLRERDPFGERASLGKSRHDAYAVQLADRKRLTIGSLIVTIWSVSFVFVPASLQTARGLVLFGRPLRTPRPEFGGSLGGVGLARILETREAREPVIETFDRVVDGLTPAYESGTATRAAEFVEGAFGVAAIARRVTRAE